MMNIAGAIITGIIIGFLFLLLKGEFRVYKVNKKVNKHLKQMRQ